MSHRTRDLVSRVCGTLTALSMAVGSPVAAQDAPDVRQMLDFIERSERSLVR